MSSQTSIDEPRPSARPDERARAGLARRLLAAIGGAALCVIGVILLPLPGPGLLVVLAGLALLASEFSWAHRLIVPVRQWAWRAAQEGVASPLRIAVAATVGLALIGTGVAWLLVPTLPLAVSIGTGLIGSGIVKLVLLAYAYRNARR